MTPKERATMQQALEALENELEAETCDEFAGAAVKCDEAITALREALAEQEEQEPVAWMQKATVEWIKQPRNERNQTQVIATGVNVFDGQVPLYAAPVRTKDLTDDEIVAVHDKFRCQPRDFARAVIAADREKNK